MEDYSQYISPERKCLSTPKSFIQNRDTDGTKYMLDGMMGMGEDVSLRR